MGKTIELSGFHVGVSVSDVKTFVEQHTGDGTVYAIKIRHGKGRIPRAFAIIQFSTVNDATFMISKIGTVRYGMSNLKIRQLESDIVPRPRTYSHTSDNVIVLFGCPISKEKFSIFHRQENVDVKFGNGLRKVQFFLSHHNVCYRLNLSYENIWQIELHKPRGQPAKYLLIQLLGSPRIYEQDKLSSTNKFSDPRLNYFKDTPDDRWIRTTDFTPSNSIGQSSALCLELPLGRELPGFKDNFYYYKESERNYALEQGSPFSCNQDLVPIVNAPPDIEIPFRVLFKINSLVQNGCLSGPTLDSTFYGLVDPSKVDIACIEHALEKLYHLKELCYEPSKWLAEQYRKYLKSKKSPKPPAVSLDAGMMYVRRIQITPCKVYFCGPEVNVSNRVLRHFRGDIDNFLRVSFVDEELEKLYSTELSPRSCSSTDDRRTGVFRRILTTLRNGISIGNKKFEFLAFSSSQLRDNSAWMFASRYGLTASDIRNWMGNFRDIRNVAKYAARLGQSFGSSTETLSVSKHEIEVIPDIEIGDKGTKYNFSDGIGKISAKFACRMAHKCDLKRCIPSAFQIRYGGYKGVVAVDPYSSVKLSLRKSMLKYESDNTKLDVLAYSKFQPCFLNRQVITLLSTLGVEDHVFEGKQKDAITQLDSMLTDALSALEALDLMPGGETANVLKEMLKCGYKPDSEPFLSMMLQILRASKLLELRLKARIFLPNGRALMGCLDETRSLEYGQVFVQISGVRFGKLHDDSFGSEQCRIITGKVVVAKNPCLHPGDVRVLQAVDMPELHHMVDCVVFPQKGIRPHPNECSGSDLDGDIYFVCWDPELIPSKPAFPMDYTPAPTMELDHDVTMEEVEEYFANYIVNDSLGIIANAHTVFADREERRAWSEPCLELSKLFSIAVDFPKTGVPAVIPSNLHVKEYPDFMEKPDKPTYVSQSVIGKLFRQVKDIAPLTAAIRSFTPEVARRSYDRDMEVDGFEDYLDDAFYYKTNYDFKLGNLMDYYGIKTEAEILSGNIRKMSKSFTKHRDSEAINLAVKSLRKEARSWFNGKDTGLDSDADDVYAKASAWYHVTYHPHYWGSYNEGMKRDHYLSFAWCVYDKLVQIKKEKRSTGVALKDLGRDFGRKVRLV